MTQRLYLVYDAETYYDSASGYTLRKMDVPSYLLDPRFEEIGAAFKINNEKTGWVDGPDVPKFFKTLGDPSRVVCVSHNILFDACIAAWRHQWVAGFYIDTLALSRALLGHVLLRHDLDSVARYLGLSAKGTTVHKVNGMTRTAIIAAGFYDEYAAYSCLDADLCRGILDQLGAVMPAEELAINDIVHRMAIEPVLRTDPTTLHEHLAQVQARKELLLFNAGVTDKAELMSNDKFAQVLRGMGVTPPTKISLTTHETTYAFAKTDEGMKELLDHWDPAVQTVVAARLGVKSTIEETRTQRFIGIGQLDFPSLGNNVLPVPLKASGAHTHRLCLSGDTIIATLRDNRVVYVRLDRLLATDLVWDGEAFVTHGGLSSAGAKQVIRHDGITGTPNHKVWTVEYGYIELARAKAQGTDIARGEIPDSAQIDPSVHRASSQHDKDPLHVQSVPTRSSISLEGPTQQGSCVVQVLRDERPNAREETISPNGSSCGKSQSRRSCGTTKITDSVTCEGRASDTRDYAVSGALPVKTLGSGRMACRHKHSPTRFPALHQPELVELRLLRRPRNCLRLCVHGDHGRLAVEAPRAETCRYDAGPQKHQRPLRTGQPEVGDVGRTDEQPKFMETWDIVDCGPRNRFMANGRIVHNSGDWKMNLQNLSRPKPALGIRAMLRESIFTCEGYSMVVADESQVELRGTATFCGQEDLLNVFRRKEDPYCRQGSSMFGRTITKADFGERFMSKQNMLSCQYQVGWRKYQARVRHVSMEELGKEFDITDTEAYHHVNVFRVDNYNISGMWKTLQYKVIPAMTNPSTDFMLGPVRVMFEKIVLPNGMCLHYRNLHRDPMSNEWIFTYGRELKKLYGGKLLENIIQALCRIIVMNVALRLKHEFKKLFDCRAAMQSHDELMYVVADQYAEDVRGRLIEEMRRPPEWWPNIPLDCEAHIGKCYGKVK